MAELVDAFAGAVIAGLYVLLNVLLIIYVIDKDD